MSSLLVEKSSIVFEKIDNPLEMEYNSGMERIEIAIIGGGASGLILANALAKYKPTLFERGERLGRKLSATGNGQGNMTNLAVTKAEYFSVSGGAQEKEKIQRLLTAFDDTSMRSFFRRLGVLSTADERGRVYPSGRQASSLTDALRFGLEQEQVPVHLETQVVRLERSGDGFLLTAEHKGERMQLYAQKVVLCTGGKAAKNFGTDGSAYALAQGVGHTLTKLYPSLVQLKTETKYTKTLKGIRVNGGILRAKVGGRTVAEQGDILFTDYGISGDAVFRLSAFLADALAKGECPLTIDFLPEYDEGEICTLLQSKQKAFPNLPTAELLFGVVNNQIGRAVFRRAEGDLRKAASLIKSFPLTATGSLGFDYAQVTRGGIPLDEVTDGLESKLAKGLYFAGEGLDVDGQCGGFNLQWAYSSACAVAREIEKSRG